MRKLRILSFIFMSFLFTSSVIAGTYTPIHNLYKPIYGEVGSTWWSEINSNFDKIDIQLISEVNVKGFGAVGDDVADDTSEITAAIASISTGSVLYPAGTYKTTSVINMGAKDIFFVGIGDSSKIKNYSLTGHAVQFGYLGQTLRRGIRNMQIKGNTGGSGHGLYFNNGLSAHIENSDIGEHGGWGLYFDGASHYNKIDFTTVRDNISGGAYFGIANENQLNNVHFVANSVTAVHISANAWGIKVIGGNIEDNLGQAMKIIGSSANLIEGVWFEDNNLTTGTESIYIDNSHTTTFQSNWLGIMQKIYVKNSQGITFRDNNIGYEGVGTVANLEFESDCGENIVEGNEFGAGSTVIDKSYKAILRNNTRRNNTKSFGFHKPLSTVSYEANGETNLMIHSSFHATSQMTAAGTSPPTITYLTNDGWYDNRSNKVTFPAGVAGSYANTRVSCSNGFTFAAGKIYVISAMLKASTPSSWFFNSSNPTEDLSGINMWVDTTWRRYIFATPVSALSGSNSVMWWPNGTPASAIDLYVDDVMVLELSSEMEVAAALDKAIYIPTETTTKTMTGSTLSQKRFVNNSGQLFVDLDTTPSVAKGNFFIATNSVATTYTMLDDGVAGQEIVILFTNANTTVTDGGNMKLNGAFTSTADDVMKLIFDSTNWYELSRSVN